MHQKVTIYTLAKELDMTPSMVCRAFNPDAKVDDEKRRRVLALAAKYEYQPNRYASRLSMRTIRIGVLIHVLYSPVMNELCAGIEKAYEDLKDLKIEYQLVRIFASEKQPEACGEELQAFDGWDGVILSGFSSPACTGMLAAFAKRNPHLVFLQTMNQEVPFLFASKHDEKMASEMAAEFLYRCLRKQERKNILLFTGRTSTFLHRNVREVFTRSCGSFGLTLLDSIDMQDREEVLCGLLPDVFGRYPPHTVDGIYISSGNSISLCEYLEKSGYTGELVTFDLFEGHRHYLETGLISATIYQDLKKQGEKAFSLLIRALVAGEVPPRIVCTNVQMVMKSNLSAFCE